MLVNVNFDIDIDPNEWEGRRSGVPVAVSLDSPGTAERIKVEVNAHAEDVVRSLYTDMGWATEGGSK